MLERPVQNFDEAVAWLQDQSTAMIRASRRTMTDGTAAFPPQVDSGYEAFWLRDYAYMLAGDIGAFSDEELKAACRLFVEAQREDGAMVDCIKFDGTPIYKPGYGTMGENPVTDGSQFAVDVAWRTFQRTGDIELVREIAEKLAIGMRAVPRDDDSGLVFIDPNKGWDRCPYGFTDQIRKTGAELFSSLLFVQASLQLSELCEAISHPVAAGQWRDIAEKVSTSCREAFWDEESQLFLAATLTCRQPDIWGSAYAAFIGVTTPEQTKAIARYFAEHYQEIVLAGQVRHLPGGTYWEKTECPRDTYQNGAYWGTPVGWFAWNLRHADEKLAESTVIDMVRDFQVNGVREWIIQIDGKRDSRVPDYIASVTLPLQVLKNWSK